MNIGELNNIITKLFSKVSNFIKDKGLTVWLSEAGGGSGGCGWVFILKNILVLDMQEKNKMAQEGY